VKREAKAIMSCKTNTSGTPGCACGTTDPNPLKLSVPKLEAPPACAGCWSGVPGQVLTKYYDRSSDHRPKVTFQVAHTGDALHLRYVVEDRYVRAVGTKLHDMVCRDSCVEAFLEPAGGRGYLNFEFNAIGTMLVYHIRDARPAKDRPGFADYNEVPAALAERVKIATALRGPIDPEIAEPTTWWLTATIPVSVFEGCMGAIGSLDGQTWRGNFFKCADATSHPHWASWADVGAPLSFHKPERFAPVQFAPAEG
jgi:hypothetical protein